MKIAVCGSFDKIIDKEWFVVRALERLKHEVDKISKTDTVGYHRRYILDRCKDFKPDILLFIKPDNIPLGEFQAICKEAGCITVIWNFDWMMYPSYKVWFIPKAKCVDYVFGTDGYKPEEQEIYKKERINRFLLRQGVDPIRHCRKDEIMENDLAKYGCDVCFCGSLYTNARVKLVEFLRDKYNFRLFGNRQDNQVWYEEFSKLCRCAKIMVNDNFVNDVDGYWSDRVYLTLGHGGFLMTRYIPGLELEFVDGEHLVWWRDFNELEQKINQYLLLTAERERIAQNGYIEVHKKYTYDLRLKRMLEIINNNERNFTDTPNNP